MVEHSSDPRAPRAPGQDGADASGAAPSAGERVAKALARAGVASRRDVERLIEAGRVALNGQLLTTPAVKVAPGDILTVDGKAVSDAEPTRLWRYHKPVGLVTTHKDPQNRPTVFQALPESLPRVISIGRLDLNSEGLLLLTNDGDLARALELPSAGWMRRYRVRARGRADQAKLDRLKDGITVEGVRYGPIDARLEKAKEGREGPAAANIWLTVTLAEGKNREVRRVLEHLDLTVNRLIRLSYGPFLLGTLGAGQVEEIGPRVIREQLVDFIAPENMPMGDRVVALAQPAAKSRRTPQQGAKADSPVAPAKTKYKAGWAKPKAPFKGQKAKPAKAPSVIGPTSPTEAKARPGPSRKTGSGSPRTGAARAGAGRGGPSRSR
jgi:23S rRNA pseudouridine2605 synthase